MDSDTKSSERSGADGLEKTTSSPDPRGSGNSPAVDQQPIHCGTMLAGRYEVVTAIGSGGMGQVFKAMDIETDTLCAVKVMHNHLRDIDVNLKRFEREAQVAITLRHNNVVAVIDFGFTESQEPFIVMEYLEGKTLAEILEEKGRLPSDWFGMIFTRICLGLSYAHGSNVVHRDIKPSNIMLVAGDPERVKIVDFGIARVCKATGEICPTSAAALRSMPRHADHGAFPEMELLQHLTQPGEIFGSPLYMSPEQFYGEEADCRSEVYSLGCMMFESLAGVPPLKGANSMATLAKRVTESAPRIRSINASAPVAVDEMIQRCLERDPDMRYQTVAEVHDALIETTSAWT